MMGFSICVKVVDILGKLFYNGVDKMRKKEWSVHVMNMTPIKKIIIGLVVVCIAITLITANNLTSVMMLMAAKNNAAQNSGSVVVQQGQDASSNSSSSNSNSSSSSSGNSSSSAPSSTVGGNSSSSSSNSGSSNNSSSNDSTAADKNTSADDKGSANTDSSAKLSDAEVVDLYKKAVNAARTKSSSVIRVKDGALNYKGIAEAGGLSSAASTLMGMFMVADEASIEVKNEPWEKEKLPDASALTTNGLQKISYEDKGDKYVVTLVAKNAKNPTAGSDGVGAIAGVIEESQITGAISSVPGLQLSNINIDYEDVTTVATIDKATGNLVELKLNAPCILSLDAKLAVISIDGARVGVQVITEYTVAY